MRPNPFTPRQASVVTPPPSTSSVIRPVTIGDSFEGLMERATVRGQTEPTRPSRQPASGNATRSCRSSARG